MNELSNWLTNILIQKRGHLLFWTDETILTRNATEMFVTSLFVSSQWRFKNNKLSFPECEWDLSFYCYWFTRVSRLRTELRGRLQTTALDTDTQTPFLVFHVFKGGNGEQNRMIRTHIPWRAFFASEFKCRVFWGFEVEECWQPCPICWWVHQGKLDSYSHSMLLYSLFSFSLSFSLLLPSFLCTTDLQCAEEKRVTRRTPSFNLRTHLARLFAPHSPHTRTRRREDTTHAV